MKNWKMIALMFLAGLGWVAFGGVVIHTEVFNFWIGWVAVVVGASIFGVAVDKATDPEKRW